jgi:hypothetical protein
LHLYEILSEFNFYVRVRTYEKRVTGMQPLVTSKPNTSDCSEDSISSSVFNINVMNNFALLSLPAFEKKWRKKQG